MLVGIQLLGILFGIVMIYFSYLYFKRGNYSKKSFILWTGTWSAVIIIFAIPQVIYSIMSLLAIRRTADFFTATAIIFLTSIVFYLYTIVKKTEKKMEDLVRSVAIENVSKSKKNVKTKK